MNSAEHPELRGLLPDDDTVTTEWAEQEDAIDAVIRDLEEHRISRDECIRIRRELHDGAAAVLRGIDSEGNAYTISIDHHGRPLLRWTRAA